MKRMILQLFVNKSLVAKEIEKLQKGPHTGWNEELINAKHEELDRINHMVDLFFDHIGMK